MMKIKRWCSTVLRPFFKETSIDNMERQLDSICTIWEEEMEMLTGSLITLVLPAQKIIGTFIMWNLHLKAHYGWYKVKQPAGEIGRCFIPVEEPVIMVGFLHRDFRNTFMNFIKN
jgi:hypothetical protein